MTVGNPQGRDRPWHLFKSSQREWIRESFFRRLDCCDGACTVAELHRAALALLYAAAPYPDEALAFEMHGQYACGMHVQLVGVTNGTDIEVPQPVVEADFGERYGTFWAYLKPLTIAAHEALEMFHGPR